MEENQAGIWTRLDGSQGNCMQKKLQVEKVAAKYVDLAAQPIEPPGTYWRMIRISKFEP